MPLWGFGSFKRKISFYLVGVPINLGYENSVAPLACAFGYTHFGGGRKALSGERLAGKVPGHATPQRVQ